MARFLPFDGPPMTLKSLSCLVLAVVLGTAVTVRWYLDAEEAVHAGLRPGARPVVYQHLPLPVRAEAARPAWKRGVVPGAGSSHSERSAPVPSAAPLVGRPAGIEPPTAADPAAPVSGSASF